MYTKFGFKVELQTHEEREGCASKHKTTLIGSFREKEETINTNIPPNEELQVETTSHSTATTSMKPLTSGPREAAER